MKCIRLVAVMLVALAAAMGGAGCTDKNGEGPVEQAGKAIDKTMERADDQLKDVAADTKKHAQEAAEDVKEAIKD